MRPVTILSTSATIFAAASTAWPSIFGQSAQALQVIERNADPELVERQQATTKFNLSFSPTSSAEEASSTDDSNNSSDSSDNSSDNSDSSATATGNTSGDSSASATDDASSGSSGSSGTARQTGTATITGTGKSSSGTGTKKGSSTSQTSYDARLPAGGISMITPNAMSPASYYKIKDYVTFAWNYTSLSSTPSYIDILASCSANQATYTIAMNATVQETQTVVWDTGAYQANATIPLLTETYTLIIHDAAKDVSATAGAGYLGTQNQVRFGMYSPQPYTPLNEYVCATCNGAMSAIEKQTYGFLFGMAAVTVLSFGWFGGVAGLW